MTPVETAPPIERPRQMRLKGMLDELGVARQAGDHQTILRQTTNLLTEFPDLSIPRVFVWGAQAYQALRLLDQADVLACRGVSQCPPAHHVWRLWVSIALKRRENAEARRRLDLALSTFGHHENDFFSLSSGLLHIEEDAASAHADLKAFAGLDPTDEIDDLALILACYRRGGLVEFADSLRRIFDATREKADEETSLQHVRNLLYSAAFDQLKAFHPNLRGQDRAVSGLISSPRTHLGFSRLLEGTMAQRLVQRLPKSPVGDPRHVVIVASCLPLNDVGPHMRFVNCLAGGIAHSEEFDQVTILVTQEYGPEGPRVQDGAFDLAHEQAWRADITALAGAAARKIRLVTPERVGPVYPLMAAVSLAVERAPGVVVALQGIYESRTVAQALAADFPVIAVQTNRNNPEPPYADLNLAHGHASDYRHKPRPERWRGHKIAILPFERSSRMKDSDVGVPVALRITTAIGHGRLEKLLLANNGEALDAVCAVLDRHPQVGWSMVGVEDGQPLDKLVKERWSPDVARRLRILPRIPDLRAAFEHCDIYFQPPGDAGGAMAVVLAISDDLAVLASDCDSVNFLPAASVYDTLDQGVSELHNLIGSRRLRDVRAQEQSRFLEENHSLRAYGESFPEFAALARRFRAGSGKTIIPFLRPELPPVADWSPLLERSYAGSYFSNFGPLEREFAARCRQTYAAPGYDVVPVTNATAGLAAALLGIGRKGVVVVPAFTFPATLHAVIMAGCQPLIIDVDPDLWETDLSALEEVLSGTPDIVAVVTVRVYGFVRDQSALLELCDRHGCRVVVDAAASLGAPALERSVGSPHGEIEVFSLHATKPFAIGEGGVVFAPSGVADRIKSAINFGLDAERNFSDGGNMKLDEVRAAVGLAMLDRIEDIVRRRVVIADRYERLFEEVAIDRYARTPTRTGPTPWPCYPLRFKTKALRDKYAKELSERGVETRIYYTPSIAQGYKGDATILRHGDLLESSRLSSQILCLPLNHTFSDEEQDYLFAAIEQVSLSRIEASATTA